MNRPAIPTLQRRRANKPLPKFWRPKLTPAGVLDCQLIHWDLVTRFASGTAELGDLIDWIETGYTYAEMLRMLQADGLQITAEAQATMAALLDSFDTLLQRYLDTSRAIFTGPELQAARAAAQVMDQIAASDRHGIGLQAALWSCERIAKLNLRADLAATTPLPQPTERTA